MMKRITAVLLVLVIFITCVLTGCSNDEKARKDVVKSDEISSSSDEYLKNEIERRNPLGETSSSSTAEEDLAADVSEHMPKSLPDTVSSNDSVSSLPSSQAATATPAVSPVSVSTGVAADEMKAVWISYLEMQHFLTGKSEIDFTNNIRNCFNNCASSGLNTVIVQVRSHSDSYYNSSYYPTAKYFTGSRGSAADFDPLAIMVEEAHRCKLRIEAWVNPYRGPAVDVPLAGSGDPISYWMGTDKVFTYNGFYYLNPGEPEVRNLIINGVNEIVEHYNVDGIHFDDYFYPTPDSSIDSNTYALYGQGQSLIDFRKNCVNELVRGIYSSIKARKNITFGVSPAGNIDNNLKKNCVDVYLWGSTPGYVDYLAPQIYWAYGEGSLPYEKSLEQWKKVVSNPNIKLVVGLAAYKVGKNDNWSQGNVLERQITDAHSASNYAGFIIFRYDMYFSAQCLEERNNVCKIIN